MRKILKIIGIIILIFILLEVATFANKLGQKTADRLFPQTNK